EFVPCPDGSFCNDGQTCCLLSSGGYGCCPYAHAKCCSDHASCCPEGYQCKVSTHQCIHATSNHTVAMAKKVEPVIQAPRAPATNAEFVPCPDGSYCNDGQTCCLLSSGGYGCCPYAHAKCCSDHASCCPEGYQCKVSTHQCIHATSNHTVAMAMKVDPVVQAPRSSAAILNAGLVPCPDGSYCNDGQTCCLLSSVQGVHPPVRPRRQQPHSGHGQEGRPCRTSPEDSRNQAQCRIRSLPRWLVLQRRPDMLPPELGWVRLLPVRPCGVLQRPRQLLPRGIPVQGVHPPVRPRHQQPYSGHGQEGRTRRSGTEDVRNQCRIRSLPRWLVLQRRPDMLPPELGRVRLLPVRPCGVLQRPRQLLPRGIPVQGVHPPVRPRHQQPYSGHGQEGRTRRSSTERRQQTSVMPN
ncbi:hypothetical protein V5799_005837, partial [Amblyomma americanum]